MMDGPTIQEASRLALERVQHRHRAGRTARSRRTRALVVMTYCNLVFRAGTKRFAAELAAAGSRGPSCPTCPRGIRRVGGGRGRGRRETVLLAAPVTPAARLDLICRRSHGFVYGVNLMGVTGARANLALSSAVLAQRLKAVTTKPVLMGFGISGPTRPWRPPGSRTGSSWRRPSCGRPSTGPRPSKSANSSAPSGQPSTRGALRRLPSTSPAELSAGKPMGKRVGKSPDIVGS